MLQTFTAIGRESSEIWGLKKQLPPENSFEARPQLWDTLSMCTHIRTCVRVSLRSAEAARRYCAAKCQKQNKISCKT